MKRKTAEALLKQLYSLPTFLTKAPNFDAFFKEKEVELFFSLSLWHYIFRLRKPNVLKIIVHRNAQKIGNSKIVRQKNINRKKEREKEEPKSEFFFNWKIIIHEIIWIIWKIKSIKKFSRFTALVWMLNENRKLQKTIWRTKSESLVFSFFFPFNTIPVGGKLNKILQYENEAEKRKGK